MPTYMIGLMHNGGSVDVFFFFYIMSTVLVMWEVAVIQGNGYGIQG